MQGVKARVPSQMKANGPHTDKQMFVQVQAQILSDTAISLGLVEDNVKDKFASVVC